MMQAWQPDPDDVKTQRNVKMRTIAIALRASSRASTALSTLRSSGCNGVGGGRKLPLYSIKVLI